MQSNAELTEVEQKRSPCNEVEEVKNLPTCMCETVGTSTETSQLSSLKEEEKNLLRRQIVSLGKQPKAQQARRKKDMVSVCSNKLSVTGGPLSVE